MSCNGVTASSSSSMHREALSLSTHVNNRLALAWLLMKGNCGEGVGERCRHVCFEFMGPNKTVCGSCDTIGASSQNTEEAAQTSLYAQQQTSTMMRRDFRKWQQPGEADGAAMFSERGSFQLLLVSGSQQQQYNTLNSPVEIRRRRQYLWPVFVVESATGKPQWIPLVDGGYPTPSSNLIRGDEHPSTDDDDEDEREMTKVVEGRVMLRQHKRSSPPRSFLSAGVASSSHHAVGGNRRRKSILDVALEGNRVKDVQALLIALLSEAKKQHREHRVQGSERNATFLLAFCGLFGIGQDSDSLSLRQRSHSPSSCIYTQLHTRRAPSAAITVLVHMVLASHFSWNKMLAREDGNDERVVVASEDEHEQHNPCLLDNPECSSVYSPRGTNMATVCTCWLQLLTKYCDTQRNNIFHAAVYSESLTLFSTLASALKEEQEGILTDITVNRLQHLLKEGLSESKRQAFRTSPATAIVVRRLAHRIRTLLATEASLAKLLVARDASGMAPLNVMAMVPCTGAAAVPQPSSLAKSFFDLARIISVPGSEQATTCSWLEGVSDDEVVRRYGVRLSLCGSATSPLLVELSTPVLGANPGGGGGGAEHGPSPHELPIHAAARLGNESLVFELLDVWGAQGETGQTSSSSSPLTSFLDVRNAIGATPLWLAASKGHERVCRLLLEAGARVNAETTGGVTPVEVAVRNGHRGVVHLLLKHGAEVTDRLVLIAARYDTSFLNYPSPSTTAAASLSADDGGCETGDDMNVNEVSPSLECSASLTMSQILNLYRSPLTDVDGRAVALREWYAMIVFWVLVAYAVVFFVPQWLEPFL